jgi:uroporphyrinogen-III synthase
VTRRVLITRSEADCRELRSMVTAAGVVLLPFPVIRREQIEDEQGWTAVQAEVPAGRDRERAWILVASPRAAEPFVSQAHRREAEHVLQLPAAAIGEGTAGAARRAGLRVEVVGPGTGLGLAEVLLARLAPGTTLIFPCGHHRRDELPSALEAAGHRVLPVEVYLMKATPAAELALPSPPADRVVVTSPRAARLYLERVGGRPLPCPHLALGPTTRAAAEALGIECSMPSQPTIESLAEELCQS